VQEAKGEVQTIQGVIKLGRWQLLNHYLRTKISTFHA